MRLPLNTDRYAILLCLALLAALPPLATGQSATPRRASEAPTKADRTTRDQLARRVHELVEQLERTRASQRTAESEHQQALQRVRRQADRLNDDLTKTRRTVESLRKTIDKREAEVARLSAQIKAGEAWLRRVRSAAKPVVEAIRTRIANGLPWRRESRLQRLPDEDQLDDSAREQWGNALSALMRAVGRELEAARDVELVNQPVKLDDGKRRVHSWTIRLGLVGQGFVAEEGDAVGLAKSRSHNGDPIERDTWRRDLAPAAAGGIREAIDVLREQAPPHLVAMPYQMGGPKQRSKSDAPEAPQADASERGGP